MPNDPQDVQTLFLRLVELTPADRPAALDRECGSDADLRQRIEGLLKAHEESDSLLDWSSDRFDATVLSDMDNAAHTNAAEDADEDRTQLSGSNRSGSPGTSETNIREESIVGAVIADRYMMVQRIGEGGMGEVWMAKQTSPVKRKVALKLIKMGMDSKAVLARFDQERQALALMDHPNIAKVLDGGITATGQPFFVMELVNGLPLNKFCDESRLDIVAESLNNLAALYFQQGQYTQAEPLFTRALAIREKAVGPDHPDVAGSLSNLATLYQQQRKYNQAEPLITRALAINEKAFGPDHPAVASSLNNLGLFYATQGQYARAEPLHTRALAIREKALGPDHSAVALSLSNLAAVFNKTGQYAQAEPLFMQALAINEKALGLEHPKVALNLNNLAVLYFIQGQYSKAEPLFIRALEIREKALGPNHADVAANLSNLARTQQALGKTAEARQGFDQAVAIQRRLLPNGSPSLARILWRSASARLENKDSAPALPELEEAVAMAEKLLQPEHPHLKEYQETLARCREAIAR